MARLPLLVATLLFASNAFALVVPTAERQAIEPDDLVVGTFTRTEGNNCPRSITHGKPVELTVPHSVIMQNGMQCGPEGELSLFTDAASARAQSGHPRGRVIIDGAASAPNGALFAVEKGPRRCNGSVFRSDTTIVIVRATEDFNIDSVGLMSGLRYMIISDPRRDNLCVYSAPVMTPTPDATPVPVDPTPMVVEVTATATPVDIATTTPPTTGGSDATPSPDSVMETVSPEPSAAADGDDDDDDDDDDDSPCFPAHATVELEDGSVKRMENVELGDRVKVSDGEYSDVYMFTHKDSKTHHDFVKIDTTAGSTLTVTKGHYIYINGGVAAAGSAKTGDIVELGSGVRTSIASVKIVKSVGLYNPQTIHGDIIVNGIRSSTFTRTIEPSTAQALLTPFRMLYDTLGWSTSMLDNGAEMIAQVLPKGQVAL